MKFYLDSVNLAEIQEIASWGVLSGVTTNPTLMAKDGGDFKSTIVNICDAVRGPVSAEVTAEDSAGMIEQGREFAAWHEMVVVKLPTTTEGLKACCALSAKGIPTNLTLCFSINQALLCARAGATYVSPFVGRMEDISEDGISLVKSIAEVYAFHNLPTEIIAASIRTPWHVSQAAQAGAHIATIPPKIFYDLLKHPLTERGLDQFMNDWRASGRA